MSVWQPASVLTVRRPLDDTGVNHTLQKNGNVLKSPDRICGGGGGGGSSAGATLWLIYIKDDEQQEEDNNTTTRCAKQERWREKCWPVVVVGGQDGAAAPQICS